MAWTTQFDRTFLLMMMLTLLLCEYLLHERRRWAQMLIGLAFVVVAVSYWQLTFVSTQTTPIRGILLAILLIPLIILCLLHVTRGETRRVWMFFSLLALILAAIVLGEAHLANYEQLVLVRVGSSSGDGATCNHARNLFC